jgi:hypothetical protein
VDELATQPALNPATMSKEVHEAQEESSNGKGDQRCKIGIHSSFQGLNVFPGGAREDVEMEAYPSRSCSNLRFTSDAKSKEACECRKSCTLFVCHNRIMFWRTPVASLVPYGKKLKSVVTTEC